MALAQQAPGLRRGWALGLRRARRAPDARHAEGTEHRDPLTAVVGRPDGGAVLLGARDVRVAGDLDLHLAGDVHVRDEAVPTLGILELDDALPHDVHGGADEDEARLRGRLV